MSTPLIVTQLLLKRAEVEAEIVRLEARIADARVSVIHIASVLRLFDPKAPEAQPRAYQRVTKAMKRSRLLDLCEAALRTSAELLDTRQLGQHDSCGGAGALYDVKPFSGVGWMGCIGPRADPAAGRRPQRETGGADRLHQRNSTGIINRLLGLQLTCKRR